SEPELIRLQIDARHTGCAAATALTPSRLEGDLLRRGARGAHRSRARMGPGIGASGAIRGDRGTRAPDAPPGRRSRHLPGRRPAREDRPRVDGVVARGACAVPRHGRLELRLLAARVAACSAAGEEAAPPPRSRAAPPPRGRTGTQARLLDPGGGLAARRARAVRPRDAFRRDVEPPGPAAAYRRSARARRAHRRARRSVAAAL